MRPFRAFVPLSLQFALAVGSLVTPMSASAAGAPDPDFGVEGRVHTDFLGLQNTARALAVQPDGRIVAAGGLSGTTGIALVRYAPDGRVDFKVPLAPAVGSDPDQLAVQSLALQPDGKIVVAGGGLRSGLGSFMWAQRFHADGNIDTGFGIGGRTRVVFPGAVFASNVFKTLVLDSGKLWLVGSVSTALAGGSPAVAVLNADGMPDTTVGPGGRILVGPPVAGGASDGSYHDAVISGSAVVAVGGIAPAGSRAAPAQMLLDKLDAVTGRHDPMFGQGGRVVVAAKSGEVVTSVVAQPDGRLWVAGRSIANVTIGGLAPNPLRLRRFNVDGSQILLVSEPRISLVDSPRLALDGSGLWLASTAPGAAGRDLLLMRLTDSGALDRGFGLGGSLTVDFGGFEQLAGIAVQANGKPLLLGTSSAGTAVDFALTRIDPLR